ncbi:unnamed protein product [Paramecium octaurelia]|uniref:Uncharacterized protein n=1 Tax=Paramecium octaurelia TaxID=43137 RepID=A0A8S1SIX0_PAROT|nr:unnamed protein product [Paramecium octaurelia]
MLAKQIFLSRAQNKPQQTSKIEFPTLLDLAIEQVALNFDLYSQLPGIPEKIKHQIISKAPKTLPVTITYNSIEDENYWKQACETKWKGTHRTINICKHSYSYKIAYMENFLEEYIKSIKSLESQQEKDELQAILKAVNNWVYSLNISQTQCNIDIGFLCQYLPCLQNLTVIYGVKTTGIDQTRKEILGMKLSQAAELGEAISKHCRNLQSLSLPSNLIDDDLLRLLMTGINLDISIIELNLSHNKIGDQGVIRIAKYLMRSEILLKLDLSNNAIGLVGSKNLAYALLFNKSLEHLNLSLNSFNDIAGANFFSKLSQNKSIQHLNLSANQLGSLTAEMLEVYLSDSSCTLQSLNISNNNFSENNDNKDKNIYEKLKTGLTKNTSLIHFDISHSKFKRINAEKELQDIIVQSRLKQRKIPFVSKEEFEQQQAQNKLKREKLEKTKTKQVEEVISPQ